MAFGRLLKGISGSFREYEEGSRQKSVFEVPQGRFQVSGGSFEDPEVLMGILGGRRSFLGDFRANRRSQGRFKGVPGGFKRYQEVLGALHWHLMAISGVFRRF